MSGLIELYKKTQGGHVRLSELEFQEYAGLRKAEYLDRKAELTKNGAKDIRPCKDDSGDIVGWVFSRKHGKT